jgi:predicted translin family RNA/ssDNA-binding protein
MIDKKFINKLREEYSLKEKSRRQIISRSNDVLFQAKKTIFALHREDAKLANEKISEMETSLKKMETDFGYIRLKQEGAYQAAVEEYVEAKALVMVIDNKKITNIKGLKIGYDSYVGGLCDLIGEMVRLATNRSAKGDYKSASQLKARAEEIMMELLDFDFTGYLRTKYDQARGHLRKLEQMSYEIRLRKEK